MTFLVATNVVASQPPKPRPTGTPILLQERDLRFFYFGGLRLVCLPPKGEGKQKVAWIKKLILRKLIGAPILLQKNDLGFLIWWVQDLFAFPQRGKANEKWLRSKNLFCESCSEQPYYYQEVISDFGFGGSKTRLPSPKGGRQTKSGSDQKTYLAKVVRSGHTTIEK